MLTTKNKKLMQYVRLCGELKNAKETNHLLCNSSGESICFFACITKKNTLILPALARDMIKSRSSRFISLLCNDSIDFIHNKFSFKVPEELIDFFKERYTDIRCVKIKNKIKLSKKAVKMLNLKNNEIVCVTVYSTGFFIRKNFCKNT